MFPIGGGLEIAGLTGGIIAGGAVGSLVFCGEEIGLLGILGVQSN